MLILQLAEPPAEDRRAKAPTGAHWCTILTSAVMSRIGVEFELRHSQVLLK
jgi:hypothetical protein